MALRWAAARCPQAIFLVKADDDAFVDVPALRGLLGRTFSVPPPRRTLACNVLPAGMQPQRAGKWAVSHEDYPWPEYPTYCAGLAYVITPALADLLARVAQAGVAPRLWVDDVWVTGLLAEVLRLRPHYLNLRYSYEHDELVAWACPCPACGPAPLHLRASGPHPPRLALHPRHTVDTRPRSSPRRPGSPARIHVAPAGAGGDH
ncbi:beta-1,3-galactosyltransferase 5-like [Scylla paramamosain]|uniref:beta-1,3-galactosyltransferase 5-like n=1 Tax=Scylla paramamosain TaxID=85552 RepID=UPI0030826EBE